VKGSNNLIKLEKLKKLEVFDKQLVHGPFLNLTLPFFLTKLKIFEVTKKFHIYKEII
jgi:hypothetical protein